MHIIIRVIHKVPQRDQTKSLVPPRDFSMKSLLEHLMSEPNFESWGKLLGPPLTIQETLREL